jgi:hypothetical protein
MVFFSFSLVLRGVKQANHMNTWVTTFFPLLFFGSGLRDPVMILTQRRATPTAVHSDDNPLVK